MSERDAKLYPGRILVVDDSYDSARAIAEAHAGILPHDAVPPGKPYLIALGMPLLQSTLMRAPGAHGRGIDARKRLRGAYFALPLAHDFIAALQWFRLRYGITPVIAYTDLDMEELRRLSEAQGVRFTRPGELRSEPPPVIPPGTLGILHPPGSRRVRVMRRDALASAEVVQDIEAHIFGPWDAHCIEVRGFALEKGGARAEELTESLLRTIDAHFDGIAQSDLDVARDMSVENQLSAVRSILGISHLDQLAADFKRRFVKTPMSGSWASARRSPSDRPRPVGRTGRSSL